MVAKELGMTLAQLCGAMTPEELELWLAFLQLEQDAISSKKGRMA
jgi:hypothetical protein